MLRVEDAVGERVLVRGGGGHPWRRLTKAGGGGGVRAPNKDSLAHGGKATDSFVRPLPPKTYIFFYRFSPTGGYLLALLLEQVINLG